VYVHQCAKALQASLQKGVSLVKARELGVAEKVAELTRLEKESVLEEERLRGMLEAIRANRASRARALEEAHMAAGAINGSPVAQRAEEVEKMREVAANLATALAEAQGTQKCSPCLNVAIDDAVGRLKAVRDGSLEEALAGVQVT
jgi:hypothetical protein